MRVKCGWTFLQVVGKFIARAVADWPLATHVHHEIQNWCVWHVDELSCRSLVNLSQELLPMTACHPSTSWNTKVMRSARLPSEFCWLKCMGCVCMSVLLCPYLAFDSLLVRIAPMTCQNHPYVLSESPVWITVCFAAGEDYLSKKKEVLC